MFFGLGSISQIRTKTLDFSAISDIGNVGNLGIPIWEIWEFRQNSDISDKIPIFPSFARFGNVCSSRKFQGKFQGFNQYGKYFHSKKINLFATFRQFRARETGRLAMFYGSVLSVSPQMASMLLNNQVFQLYEND